MPSARCVHDISIHLLSQLNLQHLFNKHLPLLNLHQLRLPYNSQRHQLSSSLPQHLLHRLLLRSQLPRRQSRPSQLHLCSQYAQPRRRLVR